MKKKILIFGGSGFIASYLIYDLINSEKYDVTVVDISSYANTFFKQHNVKYHNFDITDFSQFEVLNSEKFDTIIHLASTQPANVSSEKYDPRDYINVNVIGTINILDYCIKSHSTKFILLTSHRNTQGLWADFAGSPIKEKDGISIKYDGEYAMFSISETAAQDCVNHYAQKDGIKTMIYRIPPVYGYGPHTRIFHQGKPITTGFQIFIDKAKACQPIEVWGNPDKGRDIIYVKDVVSAIKAGIEKQNIVGLFNIASGYKLSLKEEVDIIIDLYWADSTIKPEISNNKERENGIEEFVYDISKAYTELGWKPKYSFKDMLLDIEKEENKQTFSFLLSKRQNMFSK
jgi:UDP-glucose 4-epimerase